MRKAISESKRQEILMEEKITMNNLKPLLLKVKEKGGLKKLPLRERRAYSYLIIKELHYLEKNNLLTENIFARLAPYLSGIGTSLIDKIAPSLIQTLFEPFLNSIFRGFGLPQGVSDFLVSALTRNPADLMRAIIKQDCKAITEIIVESGIETLIMYIQRKVNTGGSVFDFFRNEALSALESSNFSEKLIAAIQNKVCELIKKTIKDAGNLNLKGLPGFGS